MRQLQHSNNFITDQMLPKESSYLYSNHVKPLEYSLYSLKLNTTSELMSAKRVVFLRVFTKWLNTGDRYPTQTFKQPCFKSSSATDCSNRTILLNIHQKYPGWSHRPTTYCII